MKIIIKGDQVTIADDTGVILIMTTEQLFQILRTLNAATNAGGGFFFEVLEFTV